MKPMIIHGSEMLEKTEASDHTIGRPDTTHVAYRMKTVGRRIVREPALRPSGELLRAAATINDTLKALLPGGRTCMPKGIYRFRTLDEANLQQAEWLAQTMAEIYLARRA